MIASREKPPSPRRTIFASGQDSRICATVRCTSSRLPAAASMLVT
jgi:hypothetical protein